jgi:phosphoribosylformylglycinamidine cyclo-ligase
VRKVFFDLKKISLRKYLPALGCTLGEELLRPTRIYVKAFDAIKSRAEIKGMAHITGGGIDGNLPRIFPKGTGAVLIEGSWPVHPIFELIRKTGNVPAEDMKRTFNMGIGYVLVVDEKNKDKTLEILNKIGFNAYLIGRVQRGLKGVVYAKD